MLEQNKKLSKDMINGGNNIVELAEHQGTSESMLYIEKALALDPENADAWRMLSIPYLKRGMPVKWKPLFDKAVTLNPQEWQGWRGYLYLYFYRNYSKAIEDFDATDMLTPNFDDAPQGQSVNYMRGVAYLGLKNYEKSLSYFSTYIEEKTTESGEGYVDVTAFLYRGIVYFEMNNLSEAKANLFKVLKNSGEHYADAHYYLAQCFLAEKQNDMALIHIKKAEEDFKSGYVHKRNYVEVLYQIYPQDIGELENSIRSIQEKE